MKYFALLIGIASYLYLNFTAETATDTAMTSEPFAVVELFTSEGCYSCPPADELLSEIIEDSRENNSRVFALAFHVDYWDRLGWKDAYSDKKYSDRQREYAYALKSNSIYTPQMIVNGTSEFVGSESKTAFNNISRALDDNPKTEIKLTSAFNRDMDMLTVNCILKGEYEGSKINFALVERGIVREIGHGENGGKTLRHDNVVRLFKTDPAKKSVKQVFNLPDDMKIENSSVIAYLQNPTTKKIIGAERIDLQ